MRTFKGGIHPLKHEGKLQTRDIPVRELVPSNVIIPMSMSAGAPASPCVKKGDRVLKGQVIGEPVGFLGIPIHASIAGTVTSVEYRQQLGASSVLCVEIENDYTEESVDFEPHELSKLSPEDIVNIVKNAGICGLGGAAFPTHVKLTVPEGKRCEALIINGAECETHLTADCRLMLEEPERIINGAHAAMRALRVDTCIICIESNKPECIEKIKETIQNEPNISVLKLRTKYPQGSEKQLVKAALGREIPTGGLPIDAGAVVINAGTAAAIADAVYEGLPLISRITTVTGDVHEPANFKVRIGTTIAELLGTCGGFSGEAGKIIMGGTMTGFCAYDCDISVVKGTGGIIVCNEKHAHILEESPCIRCARCVEVCPMGLSPYLMKAACDKNDMETAKKYHIMDCLLCGCCSFTCPASRYLTPTFKNMKDKISAEMRRNKK